MKLEHKIIRDMLRCKMIKPTARDILYSYLPGPEADAIYWADVEQENLGYIADIRLHCSERAIKERRRRGYAKLMAVYFPK